MCLSYWKLIISKFKNKINIISAVVFIFYSFTLLFFYLFYNSNPKKKKKYKKNKHSQKEVEYFFCLLFLNDNYYEFDPPIKRVKKANKKQTHNAILVK